MAETSALEEDLSQRLYVPLAHWFIIQAPRQLVCSSHGFSSFFVRLMENQWAWPFTLLWVVLWWFSYWMY
jgi:hypothetical protein